MKHHTHLAMAALKKTHARCHPREREGGYERGSFGAISLYHKGQ